MPDHLTASLIVALIGGIVDLDSTAAVQCMISQPAVVAPLTGFILGAMVGDAETGLKLGLMVSVILQLAWIEQLPLGMNVPPDATMASVLSVALGFFAGKQYEYYADRQVCYTVAIIVAVGLGLLGRGLDMFVRRINTNVDFWVNSRIEENDFRAIRLGHLAGGVITFTKAFIFCFLVAWFGIEPLKLFTDMLSSSLKGGFIVLQGLLPAVGFAVLASMCLKNKDDIKYFIVGILMFNVIPSMVLVPLTACFVVMYRYYKQRAKAPKKKVAK